MKHLFLKPLLVLVALAAAGFSQAMAARQLEGQLLAAQAPVPSASVKSVLADAPYVPTPLPSVTSLPGTPAQAPSAAPAVTPVPSAVPTATAKAKVAARAGGKKTAVSAAPVQAAPASGYTVQAGRVFHAGQPVILRGVNWFGFDTQGHVAHGLWARNWRDMITQIKATGFTAVRLPICPASLNGAAIGGGLIDYSQNADLQGLNSQQVLDKVVTEMDAQGLYVLLDMHRFDCDTISPLWYTDSYSENQWLTDLRTMATRYAGLPHVMGIDLKNEPQGSATWGTGNQATDWDHAAALAGESVLSVNPNLLVFVEGVERNPTCSDQNGHFWGGNLAPAACAPINASYIPANKLVYSPHVYGPDVYAQSYFSDPTFPANMPGIWDAQFGFLAQQGATVIPGEWGGRYGTGGGVGSDVTWQNALVSYFASRHICNSFYWSWNPNSGDTGGVLQDDWKTPWPQKLQLFQSYWNSCPA